MGVVVVRGLKKAVTTLIILMFVGCGMIPETQLEDVASRIADPFAAQVTASLDDGSVVEGDLERQGSGLYTFKLSAPPELAGLTIKATNEGVLLEYDGMSVELDNDLSGAPGIVPSFNRAIDVVLGLDGVKMESVQDQYIITGNDGWNEFTLTLDEGCVPIKYSLSSLGTEMVFTQFNFVQ